MSTEPLFERDYYRWTQDQAALMREGRLSEIDLEHVAEELENMGARERRELISRLAVLLAHLLKWQYQPERRGRGWRLTVNEQRRQLDLLLEDSPSLRGNLVEYQTRAYRNAVQSALDETGFIQSPFPAQCPYSVEQALDTDFWPQ